MPQMSADVIAGLVSAAKQLREILDRYPALKPVADELLTMPGPLPQLGTVTTEARPARRARRPISAARRKQMSLTAKRRWAAVKKAGKSSLGKK